MEQQQLPTSINMELEDDLDYKRKRSLSSSSSSESIDTVYSTEADWRTVKPKNNKKRCTQMTTPAELSESEGETEVQTDTPKQKQINNTPALETNNSTHKQAREAKIILHQRETVQEPQQEPAWRTISPPNSYAGVVQGARPIPKPRKRTPPTGNSKPTQQLTPAPTTPTPTDNNAMMEALLTALNDLKKQVADYRKKTGACKKEWLTKTTKTNRQGKIQPTQDRKTSTSKRSSAPAQE
ncbi:hypothetical protein ACOMHN_039769 [Nucella lapillus]